MPAKAGFLRKYFFLPYLGKTRNSSFLYNEKEENMLFLFAGRFFGSSAIMAICECSVKLLANVMLWESEVKTQRLISVSGRRKLDHVVPAEY
jgi:hypothetical protein